MKSIGLLGIVLPRLVARGVAAAWFRPARRPPGELPDGAESFSFEVADRTVTGYGVGAGAPVLLVHGWGGVSTDMGPIATAIAASGRRAIVPDLPGHGRDPRRRTDLFVMGTALDAVVATFGAPDVVIAHSFGAAAVLSRFSHGGPSDVVFVAPAIRMDRSLEVAERLVGLRRRARNEFRRRVMRFAGPAVARVMEGRGDVPGARITIFHDPEDPMTPIDDSRAYVDGVEGRRLVEVPGVGHRRILSDRVVVDQVVATLTAPADA